MQDDLPAMSTPPEYASVEEFVEFMMDDDREVYDHEELGMLSYNLRLSPGKVRAILADWGLQLAARPKERKVRGILTNNHDRFFGPGSCRTHGGSGWEQILGFSGAKG